MKERAKEYGTNLSYVWLRQVYAKHLIIAYNLANPTTREELEEINNRQL